MKRQNASLLHLQPNPLAYSSFYSGVSSENDEEEIKAQAALEEAYTKQLKLNR